MNIRTIKHFVKTFKNCSTFIDIIDNQSSKGKDFWCENLEDEVRPNWILRIRFLVKKGSKTKNP